MRDASSWTRHEEMLNLLPLDSIPSECRQRLRTLSDELDRLLFLDETDELAADRKILINIASNNELVPEKLKDIFLVETSKHLGRRLKEFEKGHRLSWHEAGKYGLPI